MDTNRRPSLFWPLALIGAGILLLLQNLNLLPPGTLAALVQLWPVFLILLGLDMLIGRRSALGAAFMLVISIVVIVGALVWAALRATGQTAAGPQPIVQYPYGAERAKVIFNFQVGELSIGALGDSLNLMEGQVQNGPGESVKQDYAVVEGLGQLALTQQQSAVLVPFLSGQTAPTVWEIRLSPKFPLTLDVDTGVGSATLDLSELALTELRLDTGVGQTAVIFPASGAMLADLNTGVGDVTLTIPENLPTRITVKSGLTSLDIASRFARSDDVYTTANFSTTGDYLDVMLDAGVGSVTIR
jgi:hypothetical protein